jgi:ATP-dependent RNA helicase DHX8/PRP22
MSSPELWEARQLIASGVLSVSEYPNFDPENGGFLDVEETEEELEVELNEDEPAFLAGQMQISLELEPPKIVRTCPSGRRRCRRRTWPTATSRPRASRSSERDCPCTSSRSTS